MTSPTPTPRARRHRSKKKRVTLALAPVAALAVIVPLMAQAGAATPSEVTADCAADSDRLANCEFVDVQFKANSLGPNQRVSPVIQNCGTTTAATGTFSVSTSVTRTIQLEEGFTASADSKLGNSFFEIGLKFNTSTTTITTDDKTTGLAFSRTDTVQPNNVGFFMWSAKRTDVSGFLRATYKEPQDGQTVFFAPSEGGTSIHVFYPQILKNGTPDGRLWLRNVQCGTPEADAVLNSGGPDAGVQSVEGGGAPAPAADPGFGEGGTAVTDVEIPLGEIPAQ